MHYRALFSLPLLIFSPYLFSQAITNIPANPILDHGANLWLRGDLLVWQAAEDNIINCYVINSDLGSTNRDFNNVDFEWDCGVRVIAGYNLPHDGWDIAFTWTHFITDAHSSVTAKGASRIPSPVWGSAFHNAQILFLEQSKAHWHLRLDQIELNLGRSYFVGDYLTLRPNFGLRNTWIHQKLDVDYTSSTPSLSTAADLKDRFWGLGLTMGVGADWIVWENLSLFGETDYAILLGNFEIDQKGKRQGVQVWKQSTSFHSGKSVLDIAMGLKYQTLFNKDRLGFTVKAGYEYHLYFNQNQFLVSNGSDFLENFINIKGNLAFQGVMISGQFDF